MTKNKLCTVGIKIKSRYKKTHQSLRVFCVAIIQHGNLNCKCSQTYKACDLVLVVTLHPLSSAKLSIKVSGWKLDW